MRRAEQDALPVRVELVPGVEGRADDLLRRDAVDVLGVGAHEVLPGARDDVRLEAAEAQEVHRLEHRLVDELRVGTVPARVARPGEPAPHDGPELVGGHAGLGRDAQGLEILRVEPGDRRLVAGEDRRERLPGPPLGVLGRELRDAVEHEEDLRVHRVLDPRRPVLIEGHDALIGPHEVRARGARGRGDEVEDGLLRGAVVPRGQRVLGARGERHEPHGEERRERQSGVEQAAGRRSRDCCARPHGVRPSNGHATETQGPQRVEGPATRCAG